MIKKETYFQSLQSWFPEFVMPQIRYPFRGGEQIVKFAQDHALKILEDPSDTKSQKNVQLPNYHLQDMKIPRNLLQSFDVIFKPKEMTCRGNFGKVFKEVFENISGQFPKANVLIIKTNLKQSDLSFFQKTFPLMFPERQIPLFFGNKIQKSPREKVQQWIQAKSETNDLITDPFCAAGFEAEFVIVIGSLNSLSAISRATLLLAVIEYSGNLK